MISIESLVAFELASYICEFLQKNMLSETYFNLPCWFFLFPPLCSYSFGYRRWRLQGPACRLSPQLAWLWLVWKGMKVIFCVLSIFEMNSNWTVLGLDWSTGENGFTRKSRNILGQRALYEPADFCCCSPLVSLLGGFKCTWTVAISWV